MEPNQALIASVESILDDDEIDAATRNRALIDTVEQFIVVTGAVDKLGSGAPKARSFDGAQSPDIVVADIVKRAPVVEAAMTQTPRGSALTALHKRADELAVSQCLSRPKAVAKIAVSRDPRDRVLW